MPNGNNNSGQLTYQIVSYTVIVNGVQVVKKAIIYYDKSGKEITREQYKEDATIIDDGFKNPTSVDKLSFCLNTSEDSGYCEEVSNRFIKRGGGSYTNITPFVLLYDSVLVGITLSSREASQWTAVIFKNDEEVESLFSGDNRTATKDTAVKFSKGDRVSMFVRGRGVINPGIETFFTSILNR